MTYPYPGPNPGPSGYPQQGPYSGQPVVPGYPAYGPPGYGPMPGQPMPYGYPGATPPNSGGPGKWILIAGAVVLVLVLGGVGIYALTGSSDDDQSTSASSQSSGKRKGSAGSTDPTDEATTPGSSGGGSSDEDEIRQFLASFGGGDMASISCANDRKFFGQAGGGAFGSMQIPKVAGDADSMQALDITVTGDRATVKPPGSSQVAFWLRKEGGEWKFCSTDNPVFKNLPGTR